ncbi:putative diguanylate cyclase YdaM [Jeotgalicoccus saudimassiliensis]|uniref:Putative diguanylate cyclase YdaM n=1 Tax=Jeotgalicoccus saudimassiliensis TaxID=1461582 RepID=A0A078M8K4_9STAP|nr:GGDEF domain-containing protein [Jeotgalicoccus saudimassiliensis]CEA01006.1 putative diguanylate cyclase YdaM [Jeotgalicoccus saudimassiliensis]
MILQVFTLVCVMMALQAIYYQIKIRLKLAMASNIYEKVLSGVFSALMAVILSFYAIEFSYGISIGLAVTSLIIGLIYSGQLTFTIGYVLYGFWYFLNPNGSPTLDFWSYLIIGLVLVSVNHPIRYLSVYFKAIISVITYAGLSAFFIYLVSRDISFTALSMSLYIILATIGVFAGVILITYMQNYKKMFDQMEFESMHDALTGLLNRRHFNLCINELKPENSVSMLMLDIDKFKNINDTYGHSAGDAVLQAVATDLKKEITDKHSIARTGGEEFAVILRKSTMNEAKVIAENVRRSVEELNINIDEIDHPLKVTVSIGISSYPEETDSIKNLYDTSDERLYFAKKLGRNQIQFSTPKEILTKLK